MDSLIKISINESEEQVVSGRELHEFLEVGTQYTKWFEDLPRTLVTSVMS